MRQILFLKYLGTSLVGKSDTGISGIRLWQGTGARQSVFLMFTKTNRFLNIILGKRHGMALLKANDGITITSAGNVTFLRQYF
jgi:hypothetical protein